MRSTRPLIFVSALVALSFSSCRTQRQVLSGPTNTGLENSPSESLGDGRFSNQDPYGYMNNGTKGLNTMSEKMFDGKLEETSTKQLSTSRSFLTREFGGQKKFKEKEFAGSGKRTEWEDTLFEAGTSRDETLKFQSADRQARTFDSRLGNRLSRAGDFAGADKTAATGEYYPAAKAGTSENSRPPMAGEGSDSQKSKVKALIESRTAEGAGVSINDIRSLVGKQ